MGEPASGGVLADVRDFLLHRPEIATLVRCADPATREAYTRRIVERLGIDLRRYAVLNIHRIGIDVPVSSAFLELREWSGESRPEAPSRVLDPHPIPALLLRHPGLRLLPRPELPHAPRVLALELELRAALGGMVILRRAGAAPF